MIRHQSDRDFDETAPFLSLYLNQFDERLACIQAQADESRCFIWLRHAESAMRHAERHSPSIPYLYRAEVYAVQAFFPG